MKWLVSSYNFIFFIKLVINIIPSPQNGKSLSKIGIRSQLVPVGLWVSMHCFWWTKWVPTILTACDLTCSLKLVAISCALRQMLFGCHLILLYIPEAVLQPVCDTSMGEGYLDWKFKIYKWLTDIFRFFVHSLLSWRLGKNPCKFTSKILPILASF